MKTSCAVLGCWLAMVVAAVAQGTLVSAPAISGAGSTSAQSLHQGAELAQTVPPWVNRAQKLDAAEGSKRVVLTVYLSWQHQNELEQLFRDQIDPRSARYQQFLTPAQFHAAFSPTAEDVAAVEQALRGLGFQIGYIPESKLFVRASGTVSQVRQAFGVSQDLYLYRGKTLRAHAEAPTLPPSLRGLVTYIAGLDDSRLLIRPTRLSRLHGINHQQSESLQPPYNYGGDTYSPCSTYWDDTGSALEIPGGFPYGSDLPWIICGYTPQQIRTAYRADQVHQTGRGVTVAITDLYASPTLVSDVNTYSANHGLPPLTNHNFREILLPNVNQIPPGDPCGSFGWQEEQTLDLTALHSMAPGASIIFIGGACDAVDLGDGNNPVEPLYYAIDHRVADVVSNSWAWNGDASVPPGQLLTDNLEFLQAAVEGMSLLFGSGDDGDLTQSGLLFGGPNPIASGSWPSTSPLVTSVGGTSLLLRNARGDKTEYGWASYTFNLQNPLVGNGVVSADAYQSPYWTWGGGGGPSLVMPEPFYQLAIVPTILATQTVTASGQIVPLNPPARVTPDIAMDADPDTALLVGETFTIFNPPLDPGCTLLTQTTEYCEVAEGYGTSVATPLLAGVLALVNENRYSHRKGPLGFINPALYALQVGQEGSDQAPIMDVNAPSQPMGYLFALKGIDNYAGVGTIDSTLDSNGNIVENVDSSLKSAPGYDPVTGLGVPNVPAFITALSR